jgi:vancomycin resistance protein YoaR
LELLVSTQDLAPIFVYDEQVAQAYLETLAEKIDIPPTQASLAFDGVTPVVTDAQPGRKLDVSATLALLSPVVRNMAPAKVEVVVLDLPPTVTDAETARAQAEAMLASSLTLVLPQPGENDPGPWEIPPEQLVAMLAVREEGGALHTTLDEGAVRGYLQWVAPSLVVEPVDARFHFNDRTDELEPISPSEDGRALDINASVASIVRELEGGNHYVPLELEVTAPRYPDTALAEEVGIVELVAEGDSYFIGSPSGRDHNIRLAATKFDGIVIPPGETFSFNHFLGEVSAEAGYDESYITAGEQLAIEVGGGICQVSTTAFRAAFWGGYPITERWPHNNRIGYYELRKAGVGMDATVYSPYVDLRFVNDRDYPLLIETEIEDAEHRLVFRFYSTDDGRQVEKEGPDVSGRTKPGPPIYQLDEDLDPGTVVKWQSAVDGLTAVVVRKVYDAAGDLVAEDTFVSKHDARRAAYHYGTGYVPPEGGD